MKLKNFSLLLIIFLSIILYAGCNKTKPNDDENANKINPLDKVIEVFESLNLPEETSVDLSLNTIYNEVVIATWTSSNEAIMTSSGVITKSLEDRNVTLTVELKYETASLTKEFTVKVLKDEKLYNDHLLVESVMEKLILTNSVISSNIILPKEVDGVSITWESMSPEIIDNEGNVVLPKNETEVILVGKFTLANITLEKEFKVTIASSDILVIEVINQKLENFSFIKETSTDVDLPSSFDDMSITWESKTISYINSNGVVKRSEKTRNAKLEATFTYEGVSVKKIFEFKILAYTIEEMLETELAKIDIPTLTNVDLSLPVYFEYDIIGEWVSSDQSVITNDGEVILPDVDKVITLKVTLRKDNITMEKTFNVNVLSKNSGKAHQIVSRAISYDLSESTSLELVDGRMVLKEGVTEGVYTSKEIETIDFSELVASWASTSNENATVELKVSVRIDGVWSGYISYYPWGFGLQNKCYDQTLSTVKLVEDEVKVLANKTADAVKFTITLRRTNSSYESPKFSLASFALESTSYAYPVDISSLPKEVVHSVPKLYQQIVPSIGNSICSPTTSTMLLKYKGENFSQFDEYEHRYIALKFREYNSMLFGNWVYNTVGMSSFGYNTYVARMYSIEELVEHLANVGPVGLSVKGQMTSDKKDYYTGGHLIVGIGYRYIDGDLYIVCNDPNVPEVECMYSYTVMRNTWRNVAYIIE